MVIATDQTPKSTGNLSLDDFLQLSETKPASELINGVITQKPMPTGKHGTLQFEITSAINQQTKPQKLAYAIPELRCTFAGRSIVPDIVITRWENLPRDKDGTIANYFRQCPDWMIEILSPNQSHSLVMEKILFCLNNGTEMGWIVDPKSEAVTVFLPDQLPSVHLAKKIKGSKDHPLPMMRGLETWQLYAKELFSWLEV